MSDELTWPDVRAKIVRALLLVPPREAQHMIEKALDDAYACGVAQGRIEQSEATLAGLRG